MPDTATLIQERVSIAGSAGSLEGILAYSESLQSMGSIFVVGPHPMLGGDFENNVVRELATGLAATGRLTLRFNFRGVGESDGDRIISSDNLATFWAKSRIDEEKSFIEDTRTAAEFLRSETDYIDAVVGYSFGAWLAAEWITTQTDVDRLILIAPTIALHDYSQLKTLRCKKLIISSSDDFAVPRDRLEEMFSTWTAPKQLVIDDMDGHFFRGHENRLVATVSSFLTGAV